MVIIIAVMISIAGVDEVITADGGGNDNFDDGKNYGNNQTCW